MDYNYFIAIDSGSSGSRAQIYKWEAPRESLENPASPPKIIQEKGWSLKITPGISSFANNPKKAWKNHYKKLLKFAEDVIPKEKRLSTPVRIMATAGMRLLPEKKQEALIQETCKSLAKYSKFQISPDCSETFSVIDGSTEGIYGWLALNYLMGSFDDYNLDSKTHESIGFMDMGGASTQVAFVPSLEEAEKHKNDLTEVRLRNLNGKEQKWPVFTATWLGFGANQAKQRYLTHLVSSLPESARKNGQINAACFQKNLKIENFAFEGKKYTFTGTGHHAECLNEIHPLLLKHIPCEDEPCLFNGIHVPKMDFEKDKFVGVSEYWYTANDIFKSGGEYNFHIFSDKTREFCETEWDKILERGKAGDYNNVPESYLFDACFKASWLINILHEGFGLPRVGIEVDNSKADAEEEKKITQAHVPFKSAESVNGQDLAWTLGSAVIMASSQIAPGAQVGIVGGAPKAGSGSSFSSSFFLCFFIVCIFLVIYYSLRSRALGLRSKFRSYRVPSQVKRAISEIKAFLPPQLKRYLSGYTNYVDLQEQNDINRSLEAGIPYSSSSPKIGNPNLRTRSAISLDNLQEPSKPEFFYKPF